jgi:hypothetical protein
VLKNLSLFKKKEKEEEKEEEKRRKKEEKKVGMKRLVLTAVWRNSYFFLN